MSSPVPKSRFRRKKANGVCLVFHCQSNELLHKVLWKVLESPKMQAYHATFASSLESIRQQVLDNIARGLMNLSQQEKHVHTRCRQPFLGMQRSHDQWGKVMVIDSR